MKRLNGVRFFYIPFKGKPAFQVLEYVGSIGGVHTFNVYNTTSLLNRTDAQMAAQGIKPFCLNNEYLEGAKDADLPVRMPKVQ